MTESGVGSRDPVTRWLGGSVENQLLDRKGKGSHRQGLEVVRGICGIG